MSTLDEMPGETVWAPNLPYETGDIVVRSEPARRTLWEWIRGRPARDVQRRYICVCATPQEWMPYINEGER